MSRPRVLVVRPEPQAGATAEALEAAGFAVTVEPMLRIVPEAGVAARIAALEPPAGALIATSANALAALAGDPALTRLLDRPLVAVGPATAARARDAGFRRIVTAEGDAEAAVTAALALPPTAGPLVHVAGRDRAGAIAERLAAAGRSAETVEAYRAEAAETMAAETLADLVAGRFLALVSGSARTSAALAGCLRSAGHRGPIGGTTLVTLSEAAAMPLNGLFPERILADATVGQALTKAVVALHRKLSEDEDGSTGRTDGQETAGDRRRQTEDL